MAFEQCVIQRPAHGPDRVEEHVIQHGLTLPSGR
jgi:hypothetical protein